MKKKNRKETPRVVTSKDLRLCVDWIVECRIYVFMSGEKSSREQVQIYVVRGDTDGMRTWNDNISKVKARDIFPYNGINWSLYRVATGRLNDIKEK